MYISSSLYAEHGGSVAMRHRLTKKVPSDQDIPLAGVFHRGGKSQAERSTGLSICRENPARKEPAGIFRLRGNLSVPCS
jgi:hypothetical protein